MIRICLLLGLATVRALVVDNNLKRADCLTKNEEINTANAETAQNAQSLFNACKVEEKRNFLLQQCPDVINLYAPFDLTDEVAFKNDLIEEPTCTVPERDPDIPNININENYPTVMMVGETGAGKSYLGNAIFGESNPRNGPFTTGDQLSSETKYIQSIEATFFGNRSALADIPSFKLNIVDSPGFEDSNILDQEDTAKRISSAFDFGVNAIVLVIGTPELKISQIVQRIFSKLHHWTNGQSWKHLTILLRVDFGPKQIFLRAEDDISYWSQYHDVNQTVQFLVEKAEENDWKMDEGTRLLQPEDIDLAIIPFDASQTRFCGSTHPMLYKYCEEMPVWESDAPDDEKHFDELQDDDDDYHMAKYNGTEIEPTWLDDLSEQKRYFFIEAAKLLAERIQNSTTKLTSPKQLYREKLNFVNKEYHEKFGVNSTESKLPTCFELKTNENNKTEDLYSCPDWGNWVNNGSCASNCEPDNYQHEIRSCSRSPPDQEILDSILCETSSSPSSRFVPCNIDITPQWSNWGATQCYGTCDQKKVRTCTKYGDPSVLCNGACSGASEIIVATDTSSCGITCIIKWSFSWW